MGLRSRSGSSAARQHARVEVGKGQAGSPWGASGVGMERHSLFVLLQPGGAVGQQTKVLGDQQVQQAVVVGLGVQLEQRRVDVLLVAVGHLRAADLVQVAHEEALALGHLVLVTLCQLVEVCELVQGRVGAGERGGSGQQERVQGDELPHVELAAPAVTGAECVRGETGGCTSPAPRAPRWKRGLGRRGRHTPRAEGGHGPCKPGQEGTAVAVHL